MELLREITGRFKRPPLFTSSALRPICLAALVNDIVINRRQTIVELGAGVSTLYFAAVFKHYGIPGKLYTVDEDPAWLGYIGEQLAAEGLAEKVELIVAPVVQYPTSSWYDKASLAKHFPAAAKIDVLMVDGPTAYTKEKARNRELAYSFFAEHLAENSLVYLDDCDRAGEKSILQEWAGLAKAKGQIRYRTGGFLLKGAHYNFYPL
ncbi:class I SAM-dependent methyltransferase [Lewinella lacunae]|uniref:Class I SAM-dependent methyltransferase n=2 Tax=Neolewinella lacunae TaxID=1517758 RepID=A0A923PHH9_9BACT|nr:class I SAM-dependent methyltransferase [Neolewinella lacunae]